jgi:pSer/pThr/pTyr-binding forkhead associated (FHA) protein
MRSVAANLQAGTDSRWTFLTGAMKGTVQMLSLPVIIIGRNTDCNIVIVNDPKCSRTHAKVLWTSNGFEIQRLSSHNSVSVNGQDIENSSLEDGDVISIGDTEIKFNAIALTTSISSSQQEPRSVISQATRQPSQLGTRPPAQHMPPPQSPATWGPPPIYPPGVTQFPLHSSGRPMGPPPQRQAPQNSNNKRFYIYGFVVLIGIWLFMDSSKKKKELQIRTEQDIKADIETAKKLQETSELSHKPGPGGPLEARQAQENYIKGFRDFRKGQYERSLESFQACLALQPDHLLCNRYLRLSQRKFNELVQYHMVLGRKYRDQNQFRACRSAFRNVMVMIKDPNTPTYKEAKANFDACNTLVEGRF